ncbi:MAG: hypothetical protein LC749_03860 [Actinobacteria bacterium]|nr:hypothetical protein [Actinomycetota bacterium]
MMRIADLSDDHPSVTLWMRGVFRLADGRRITRTVCAAATIAADDEERKAVLAYKLVEEIEHAGHHFPEGHAVLVELLGTAPS